MKFKAYFTDHFVNKTVMQFFAKSLNIKLLSIDQYQQDEEIFCSYGILRGTAEPIKISKNFLTKFPFIVIAPNLPVGFTATTVAILLFFL